MFYNAQAFADAGLEAPKTIDEMLTAIQTLSGTNENGQQEMCIRDRDKPLYSGLFKYDGAVSGVRCRVCIIHGKV